MAAIKKPEPPKAPAAKAPGGNPQAQTPDALKAAGAMMKALVLAKPGDAQKKVEAVKKPEGHEPDIETADTRRDIDTAIFEPTAPRETKPKPGMPKAPPAKNPPPKK